jgi:hypothetical protein
VKQTATAAQPVVGLIGLAMITLGLLFWSGNAPSLVPLHMLLGLLLVALLWTLAIMGARAHVPARLVVISIVWGFVVPILGVSQTALLTGDLHWIVRVTHLLVGLVAIGLAEGLAASIRRVSAARLGGTQ